MLAARQHGIDGLAIAAGNGAVDWNNHLIPRAALPTAPLRQFTLRVIP